MKKSKKIRCFIAFFPDKEIISFLSSTISSLSYLDNKIKLVKKDSNLHITLAFLGDIEEEKLSLLEKAIKEAIKDQKSFQYKSGEFGAFPSNLNPKVYWFSVVSEELIALQKRIQKKLKKYKFPYDSKPFKPHITIGRLRKGMSPIPIKDITKLREPYDLPKEKTYIGEEIAIVESILKPEGPTYIIRKTIKIENQ